VNAAYLVLTTAWLAGDAPAAPVAPPAAPVVSAPIGGGCGGGCGAATDACCDSGCGKQSLFGKLKGKFKKRGDCGCEAAPTCCAPAPVQHNDCCEHRESLFGKLKGKFKKRGGDCGCESSCGCGGGGSGYIAPSGVPAETIPGAPRPGDAPRAMPKPGSGSVMNGVPMIVTPVVAPRLTSEQPF
jgi:hypothetical protein